MKNIFIVGHGWMDSSREVDYESDINWYVPEKFTAGNTILDGYTDGKTWSNLPSKNDSKATHYAGGQNGLFNELHKERIKKYAQQKALGDVFMCNIKYKEGEFYTLGFLQKLAKERLNSKYEDLVFHWIICRATVQEDKDRKTLKYKSGEFKEEKTDNTKGNSINPADNNQDIKEILLNKVSFDEISLA